MALKGDRNILDDNITLTAQSVAEAGTTLVYTTSGSGNALGGHAGQADVVASPSGYKVAGMLYGDVVNVDQTRYHKNFHKDETQLGERVRLITKGRLVTDKVTGTPTAGSTAYLTTNGVLTPTVSATGGLAATPKVGVFAGSKDELGFAAVDLNLPIA